MLPVSKNLAVRKICQNLTFFFSANEILPNAHEICTGAARISKKCGSDKKVNPVEGVAVGDDEIIENIMKSTKIKH